MEQIPEKESIFISGIDSSITESDLKEFFSPVIKSDCTIILHHSTVLDKPRATAEVILTIDDSILAHQQLNNKKLQNCYIKLLPKSTMKSIIISNLPDIMSEKDLFLLLNKLTAGLKRITIADDPEVCGKTANLAVVSYQSYEQTRTALETLRTQNKILGKLITASWKEPHYDILAELALETRVIYIKNMSASTDTEKMKEIVSQFGKIVKLKKFVGRALVEYENIESAKKAIEQCNEKRFDGLVWKVFPAKRFDEEKTKEKPDKNAIFSKNFLEEEDQQVLLKFAFDGTLPDISPQVIHTANNIIEAAKKFQITTLNESKQRYDNLLVMKNTIAAAPINTGNAGNTNKTNISPHAQIQAQTHTQSSQHQHQHQHQSHAQAHHSQQAQGKFVYSSKNAQQTTPSPKPFNKQSRTQDKMMKKKDFKQQRQMVGVEGPGIPRDNVFQQAPGVNPYANRPPTEVPTMAYPNVINPYDAYQRPVMPVDYAGHHPYFVPLGQNPYVVGQGQWNHPMAMPQMAPQMAPNTMNNFMGQAPPQFFGMNPGNPGNAGYMNPGGVLPHMHMGGNQMGKGYGTGFPGQY